MRQTVSFVLARVTLQLERRVCHGHLGEQDPAQPFDRVLRIVHAALAVDHDVRARAEASTTERTKVDVVDVSDAVLFAEKYRDVIR